MFTSVLAIPDKDCCLILCKENAVNDQQRRFDGVMAFSIKTIVPGLIFFAAESNGDAHRGDAQSIKARSFRFGMFFSRFIAQKVSQVETLFGK